MIGSFEDAFSEDSIVSELCKERIKLAKQRSDNLFFYRIAPDDKHQNAPTNETQRIFSLFPSRRLWHSYRPRKRRSKPSTALNFEALISTVRALRHRARNEAWARNLDTVVQNIRRRVLTGSRFAFSKPKIVPLPKNPGGHQFRPLAIFENLEDRIIDRLCARYLRESLDSALLKPCLAFRCRRGKTPPPTNHIALNKLLRLNKENQGKGLYVAECDIQGFFDCVSHRIALDALNQLVKDKQSTPRNRRFVLDPRASVIFQAYLDVYSFDSSVRKDALRRLKSRDAKAEFKWPIKDLKALHRARKLNAIGVPQGGAISCFIANAVLHFADKELDELNRNLRTKFIYMRYCDDMILVSSSKVSCQKALSLYGRTLRRKLLPIHPPKAVTGYGRHFFEGKSHLPYLWSDPSRRGAIPWIQFVGYQIRHDGLIRIRLKSFKKHVKKLTSAANELLAVLRRRSSNSSESTHIRKTAAQIVHRFRQKLLSLSVGRIKLGQKSNGPRPMCWASGFRGLVGKKMIPRWIKALDRHRERQISRVATEVRRLPKKPRLIEHGEDYYSFYGKPFSYWGQFSKKRIAKRR